MNRDRILEILFPRQQDGHSNVVESSSATTTKDESFLKMKKLSTKETAHEGCQDRDNTAFSSKGTVCAICIEGIGKLTEFECTLVWKHS